MRGIGGFPALVYSDRNNRPGGWRTGRIPEEMMPEGLTRSDGSRYVYQLTAAEKEQYDRDGYVVPDFNIGPEMLERMRAAFDALTAENPHLASDNILCPHLLNAGVQSVKGDRIWLDFARIPGVLDIVEQLVGPDFLLWGTTVFGKPAFSGKEVPMHQDGEYWPIRPLATCSAWIALDDTGPENGCLRVIPGSHRDKALYKHHQDDGDHLVLNQALNEDQYDPADAVDIRLKAGQVSFHDVYIVHGSEPNRSPNRRAGFVCRYMPTTSHFDHELGKTFQNKTGLVDFATRRVILMRGGDACGKNDFSVGAEQ